MKKAAKTNAARILDRLHIPYELLTYEVDEHDLGAENVAAKLNIPLQATVKTLVAKGDKTGVLVACLSGDREIDLKKLAFLSHNKKVEMVHLNEVLPLTGYIRGGVSPLGMKKNYPIFLEQTVLAHDKIIVSAGLRGIQLYLSPKDLIAATKCIIGDIS